MVTYTFRTKSPSTNISSPIITLSTEGRPPNSLLRYRCYRPSYYRGRRYSISGIRTGSVIYLSSLVDVSPASSIGRDLASLEAEETLSINFTLEGYRAL